jgi:hypothetical protein
MKDTFEYAVNGKETIVTYDSAGNILFQVYDVEDTALICHLLDSVQFCYRRLKALDHPIKIQCVGGCIVATTFNNSYVSASAKVKRVPVLLQGLFEWLVTLIEEVECSSCCVNQ